MTTLYEMTVRIIFARIVCIFYTDIESIKNFRNFHFQLII